MSARLSVCASIRLLVPVVFFSTGIGSLAVRAEEEAETDIRRFRIKVYEAALEMKMDGQYEQRYLQGEVSRREHVFAETGLLLGLRGSIYHPNLLEFVLQPHLGLSHQQVELDPPGGRRESTRALQRHHATASVLKEKPYATALFADRDRTYRDFDFFNRAQVDSLRYGGNTGYNAGPVPVSIAYLCTREEVTGSLIRKLRDDEETLTFNASHERGKAGQTRFSYELNRFNRGEDGASFTHGSNHSATLLDSATWGRNRKGELHSALMFTRTEDQSHSDQALALNESLSLEHPHRLASGAHYGYSHRRAAGSSDRSHEGTYTLTHQLYDSLTSRVQCQALTQTLRNPGSHLGIDRIGTGLSENYTKRLGTWGRLALTGEIHVDREQRQSAGQLLLVSEESHVLSDAGPVFLRQPNVQGVSSVTDAIGRRFSEILDYEVIPHGALVEIRRVPGGLIPNGSTVLVSYTAAAQPSGRFTTYARALQARVEILGDLFAVYGRVNIVDHTGARFLVLQDITDRVAGAEFKWGWLQVNGENESFRSNLSPFRSQRITGSLTYETPRGSVFALELGTSRLRFSGSDRSRNNTSAILRWHARPLPFLQLGVEGGVRREIGRDFDQRLTTLRSLLNFDYGKLNFDLGYEYEKESYLTDRHLKHYVFLRGKRKF